MFLRPDGRDLRIIGYHLGRVATGLALLMAAPAVLAVILGSGTPRPRCSPARRSPSPSASSPSGGSSPARR
jgi:hypothetical protein